MVLDRKTNFFLGKNGFGQENQLFPRENQRNHLLRDTMRPNTEKMGFFGFP